MMSMQLSMIIEDVFANLTPIDESALIERSQLLGAIADDDDIESKTDPFEMRPKSANPESIDIFSTSARKGRPNGYRNRLNEVGGAAQSPSTSLTPFR